MYCVQCGAEMEEAGGSQMKGCYHFLCTDCIVDAVKRASIPRVPCKGLNGIYKCRGYLEQDELEYMVPDKVYAKYLRRVMANHLRDDGNEGSDNDDNAPGGAGDLQVEEAFANLDLTEEEKNCGWAHKVSLIDDLVRNQGYTMEDAENHLDMLPILENRSVIRCSICLDDEVGPGSGVVLKDCLHMFCKECVGGHIRACETSTVECPYADDENVKCDEPLKLSEVATLGGHAEVQRHFEKLSLKEAAASMQNVAHCLTPNCIGFVVAEGARQFNCPVCSTRNCLDCKISHPGTCAQYRQQIEDDVNRRVQRQNEELNINAIQQNLNRRVYMPCPKCNTVIEKNGGCPNMVCSNRGCGHQFKWTGVAA